MARTPDRGRRSRPRQPATASTVDPTPYLYRVEALGSSGDGVARRVDVDAPSSPVFIPYTAPGDEVLASLTDNNRARLEDIVVPAPERVKPPCTLFGTCGGCSLQHIDPAWILDWKKTETASGFRKAGVTDLPDIKAFQTPPASRRRADLAVRRAHDGLVLGLHRRGGDVVDLTACHLLHPTIVALLPALRLMLGRLDLLRREADLVINLLDTGPDLLLVSDREPSTADRTKLADFCRDHGIPRLAWNTKGATTAPETLVRLTTPAIVFGDVSIEPPPGAFLQATREGEAAIRDAMLAALPSSPGRKAKIVELYAGCGTLTVPLAAHARVEAFEGHPGAVAALAKATAGQRVSAHLRDLNRQPVEAKELASAFAVVLDPPHAGAGLQMTHILDGKPETVIYVSCNPRILFRDTALLLQAGYTVDAITVIDQFLWSAETEIVCRFSRKQSRRR